MEKELKPAPAMFEGVNNEQETTISLEGINRKFKRKYMIRKGHRFADRVMKMAKA